MKNSERSPWLYSGIMASSRTELNPLRNLISEADLILETAPPLPQNRAAAARDNLRTALALVDDLIGQTRLNAAAVLGEGRNGDCQARAGLLPRTGREAEEARRWQATETTVEISLNQSSARCQG